MKKSLYCFCIGYLLFFFILTDVSAKDYQVNELIPVGEQSSVKTDHFMYSDMLYQDGYISFSSIQNLTNKKIPISFSLGLFDIEEKNIGIVNYCSEQDYDTDFANVSLIANQEISFTLKVANKYLVDGKSLSDVKYVVVLSDNEYCKIGGTDNYAGKTISQIQGMEVGSYSGVGELLNQLKMASIVVLVLLIFFWLVYSILLNMLHMRMYKKKTILAWIPICSNYLCVKLSFGKIVANIYILLYFLRIFLNLSMDINISLILSIISIISFVVVIIKLITRKYDLFVIGSVGLSKTSKNKFVNKDNFKMEKQNPNYELHENIIDINPPGLDSNDQNVSKSDNFSISMGGFGDKNTLLNSSFNSTSNSMNDEKKSNVEKDSSDDLSQFYK